MHLSLTVDSKSNKVVISLITINKLFCFIFQGKHMTNHATLQSLLTSVRVKSDVPEPCCVPSKLQTVTLMYYDENNNIVLKQYPDMMVESCACR